MSKVNFPMKRRSQSNDIWTIIRPKTMSDAGTCIACWTSYTPYKMENKVVFINRRENPDTTERRQMSPWSEMNCFTLPPGATGSAAQLRIMEQSGERFAGCGERENIFVAWKYERIRGGEGVELQGQKHSPPFEPQPHRLCMQNTRMRRCMLTPTKQTRTGWIHSTITYFTWCVCVCECDAHNQPQNVPVNKGCWRPASL